MGIWTNRAMLLALPLIAAAQPALAGNSQGNAALALACLLGEQAPQITSAERYVLGHFMAGDTHFALPAGVHTITITSEKVVCRSGNVDIAEHSCEVTFGSHSHTLNGLRGQALLATLQENGVQGDGAAGTIYFSVAPVTCKVDAKEVQDEAGGGAKCSYTEGQ